MAKDLANVRIYGDESSGVHVAAKGTTAPVDLATPTGFTEVGWLSEDGVDLDRNEDSATFNAWQGGKVVRKKTTSVDDTFKFQALEENATTVGLFYKGQAPVVTGGVAKITVTNQILSDERAWVVDFVDGAVTKRLVIPNGEVTGRASVPHKNTDMSIYEFTVTIYGDYFIYSNAPSLVTP